MAFEKYCPSLNMSLRWNTAPISRVVRELQRSTKMRGKRSVVRGLTLTSVLVDPVPPHVSQPFLAREETGYAAGNHGHCNQPVTRFSFKIAYRDLRVRLYFRFERTIEYHREKIIFNDKTRTEHVSVNYNLKK